MRIRSGGLNGVEEALTTGDHPCQMTHPEWASASDYDQAASTQTRRRMFGALAGTETLMIGTHFSAPTAGWVEVDGGVWRLRV